MERCPCCNARLRGAAQCPRCQSDLSAVIGAGQAAGFWLSKAVHLYEQQEAERCVDALMLSSALHRTELSISFRDFFIQQQCKDVLALLQQKQLIAAKQQLFKVRKLFPYNELLSQLNSFTDYLMSKNKTTEISWKIHFLSALKMLFGKDEFLNIIKWLSESYSKIKLNTTK